MILSKTRITKALINLMEAWAGLCLCCSQTTEDRLSLVEVHIDPDDKLYFISICTLFVLSLTFHSLIYTLGYPVFIVCSFMENWMSLERVKIK